MRYKCPRHGVWLVPRVHKVATTGRLVEYFECPVGCGFLKPNKWQRRPYVKKQKR